MQFGAPSPSHGTVKLSPCFRKRAPPFDNPTRLAVSQHSDLAQKSNLIVEELLLDDLPVLPSSDRAELELERLVGGWMHLTIEPFDGPYHPTRPSGDGARPVTGSKHHFIRVIVEVVLDGLKKASDSVWCASRPRVGS